MDDWVQLLKESGWPIKPTEPADLRTFEFDENPLIAAAQGLALVSYPAEPDQAIRGPAHSFCEALIADMVRLSKKRGKVARLPDWVASIKTSSMRSRLGRGSARLTYAFAAVQTVFEAERLENEREASLKGERRTFSIHSSPDFGGLTFKMPVREKAGKLELIGGVPELQNSSLRAAIIMHLEAFGKGREDQQEAYVNIYNRHVRPLFPLLSLLMVVWGAVMSKAGKAHELKLSARDILLFQPEWAENLAQKVRERQGQTIWLMHRIGIRACACSMLEVTQREKAKY